MAQTLSRLEAAHGDPVAALDHVTLAIRNYHDAGNTTMIHGAVAVVATIFDRLGHHEPAATIAGSAFDPVTAAWMPEIDITIAHLRDVLGDENYESLARAGETMTTARHGDLRIRPDRPGPSGAECCLEIDLSVARVQGPA